MAEPSTVNFPSSLDDNSTLFGDLKDLVQLTLDTDLTNSATTVSVIETLPNVPTYIIFGSEIIYAPSTGGGDFTACVRGARGTTAASHPAGTVGFVSYSGNYHNQLKRAIIAIETALGAALANVMAVIAPGTSGNVLTSNGSAWVSSALPAAPVTLTNTVTLTNKRMTKRVLGTTSSATPSINTDNCDIYELTAQTVNITSFTTNLTGTPTDGQMLLIQITGTAARTITWGTSFEASTVALPTTTVGTARLDVLFMWNTATSKWRCIGVA